jgi:hypothetical protein
MRLEVLGDASVEVEISASPDQLDRNLERLQTGKALGIASDFLEDLPGHLRKGWTGTSLLAEIEVIIDDRSEDRLESGLLFLR